MVRQKSVRNRFRLGVLSDARIKLRIAHGPARPSTALRCPSCAVQLYVWALPYRTAQTTPVHSAASPRGSQSVNARGTVELRRSRRTESTTVLAPYWLGDMARAQPNACGLAACSPSTRPFLHPNPQQTPRMTWVLHRMRQRAKSGNVACVCACVRACACMCA